MLRAVGEVVQWSVSITQRGLGRVGPIMSCLFWSAAAGHRTPDLQGTSEQVAETITLRSLSLRERDRVREKSRIIPLTLTSPPKCAGPLRGGKNRTERGL